MFFSKLPLQKIKDSNVESTSIKISKLKSHLGKQEYVLPKNLNLSVYNSWVIHCEKFSHFWDGADLKKSQSK